MLFIDKCILTMSHVCLLTVFKSSPVENYQHLRTEIRLERKLPMAPQPSSHVIWDLCWWALL